MKILFNKLLPYVILLGIVGIGLTEYLGYGSLTFLTRERYADIWMWHLDIPKYLEELRLNLNAIPNLYLISFTRQWPSTPTDVLQAGTYIIDALAYILDVLILVINIIIYPFRIAAFITQFTCALMGLPVISNPSSSGLNWLFEALTFIIRIQIPYV